MKIGQFIKAVESSKDTIRHYENLNLLSPTWESNRRIYNKEDADDFQAIKEMQELGLSLKEIQAIFEMKRQNGCGSDELIKGIINKLEEKRKMFIKEEELIKQRRMQVEAMMKALY